MAEIISVFDLMGATCAHLAGRPVTLRYRAPSVAGRDGQACKFHGRAFVDIRPGLGPDLELSILLHEAAHIRRHFPTWADSGIDPNLPGWSVKLTPAQAGHPAVARQEDEADRLAKAWAAWADSNYRKYYGPEVSDLERRLWALLDWRE